MCGVRTIRAGDGAAGVERVHNLVHMQRGPSLECSSTNNHQYLYPVDRPPSSTPLLLRTAVQPSLLVANCLRLAPKLLGRRL